MVQRRKWGEKIMEEMNEDLNQILQERNQLDKEILSKIQ